MKNTNIIYFSCVSFEQYVNSQLPGPFFFVLPALGTDVILFIWIANTIIAVLETDHIINYRDFHIEGLQHHEQ